QFHERVGCGTFVLQPLGQAQAFLRQALRLARIALKTSQRRCRQERPHPEGRGHRAVDGQGGIQPAPAFAPVTVQLPELPQRPPTPPPPPREPPPRGSPAPPPGPPRGLSSRATTRRSHTTCPGPSTSDWGCSASARK